MSSTSLPGSVAGKKQETMGEARSDLGVEMTGAINLIAHPVAATAAMTALGFGFASQAFGVWMGALTGAAEASQRMWRPFVDGASDDEALGVGPKSAAVRARAAARSLIAEAQLVADTMREASVEIVEDAVDDIAGQTNEVLKALEREPSHDAPGELMPEDFRQPRAVERPGRPDDLKAVSGIGPKLEAVLNGLGIWTYAQIAAWGPEEAAWVDDYLSFKGRIARDGWIAQARALAGAQGEKG